MEFHSLLNNGAPIIKKYQVNASVLNVGVPLLVPGAGNAGLVLATTTGATSMVGINVDTATYVTAQQTDGSSAERTIGIIVNPDALFRLLMSGGATENTALSLQTETTGSTTGLLITTGAAWNSPTFDEGSAWGYDGANAGQVRKITAVDGTSGTLTVAFDRDIAIGDRFLRAPYTPWQTNTIQLTTNLTQADVSIAVGTGGAFRTVELQCRDINDDGARNSFVIAKSSSHL